MTSAAAILVVEDEILTTAYIEAKLHNLGVTRILSMTSGEEAIQCARAENIGLVLMDINLGRGMNGIRAAREIIREKPIPRVFITGYSDREIMDDAGELDPAAILIKPFSDRELARVVRRFIRD
jgi:CheY-like chemotaxis protein